MYCLKRSWRSTLLASFLITACGTTSFAADPWRYWLDTAGDLVRMCPGATEDDDVIFKAGGAEWFLVGGFVQCWDEGDSYRYRVQFFNVTVNNDKRRSISRDTIEIDWVGLAFYAEAAEGDRVEWLYDEALPIVASIARESTDKIVLGGLEYVVPKTIAERASNMTFYLSLQGSIVPVSMM